MANWYGWLFTSVSYWHSYWQNIWTESYYLKNLSNYLLWIYLNYYRRLLFQKYSWLWNGGNNSQLHSLYLLLNVAYDTENILKGSFQSITFLKRKWCSCERWLTMLRGPPLTRHHYPRTHFTPFFFALLVTKLLVAGESESMLRPWERVFNWSRRSVGFLSFSEQRSLNKLFSFYLILKFNVMFTTTKET